MLKYCAYFLIILLSSCAVYEPVQIQVLKPAAVKIDNRISKVILVNNSVIKNNRTQKPNLDSLRTREYFYGLRNTLNNSPTIVAADTVYYFEKDFTKRYEGVNWDVITKLCADSAADAALVLENYQIASNNPPEVRYSQYSGFYTSFIAENTSLWRFYYPAEKKIVYETLYKDTVYWDASSFYEFELKNQLPDFETAMLQSCYFAGLKFGENISPSWMSKNRYLINCEFYDFQAAVVYAKNNQWEKAIEIWKKYPYGKKKRLAAYASYNLAIASEIMDLLDVALEWAAKSYFLKPNDYTKQYIELLEKRKTNKEKFILENQKKSNE